MSGVGRVVNIGLLEDEDLAPGDWVLIHVGFAMSKIDEDEARRALEGLQLLGRELDDELQALAASRITTRRNGTADMRYVDEYRDPAAARALIARITDLAG